MHERILCAILFWGVSCLALARPLMGQPTTSAPAEIEDSEILLNFPENLELKLLINYVSERLGLNIYYDEQAVNQRVTIKSPTRIPKQSLLPLLDSVLQMKGLVLVDAEQPRWKRIVPATGIIGAARASTQPATGPATQPSGGALTQVFVLQHVDASKLDPVVRPFLSQPGGSSISYPDQHLLIVTDYASSVQRIAQLIGLLDQPLRRVSTQFVHVKHLDAPQLVAQLAQLVAARQKAQGVVAAAVPAPGVEMIAEPRTNRVVLIGPDDDLREVIGLASSLDVALDVRRYR